MNSFDIGPSRDQVQAHRGASAVAPENTLAAFRAAAEQGARWVELDVAFLGDETLAVIHDDCVDRTTSGRGSLGDLAAGDVAQLDAGSWFNPKFSGERIPTLEQVIGVLGELGLSANVEIKQHKHHKSLAHLVHAVQSAIAGRSADTEIMISSFDAKALQAMQALEPNLEMAMLWSSLPPDWNEVLKAIPSKTIHLNYKTLSIGLLEEASRRDIKIRAWTSNNPVELVSFWGVGLAGVITDNPKLFLD